ncbi:hypothetical protein [Streptomyces sp. NPDC046909]|uniref:hypothetical protein n=1 Tax=Streptomyces sp. NPDC046909 TaxID=3155617 RepID=UPI0033D0812B
MEVPARIRTPLNVLFCLAAVAGAGWSGPVLWDEWRTYRAVGAGCADLVHVRDVRGMDKADTVLRNRATLDPDALPSDCLIQNAGADGDAYGAWLFQLLVDEGTETVVPRPSAELPERFARLEVPVGNGVSGLAGPNETTVRLDCPGDRRVEVTASAAYTGMSSYYPKPATTGDRARMASIAVHAAGELADRLDCEGDTAAPALAATPRFTDALDAEGTCAWYRPQEQARAHVPWLPDEAMGAPVDGRVWRERCALRLGEEKWADVQTFYDEDVRLGDAASPVAPGTAGRAADSALWWATSVCDGTPAVHVLRVDYGADSRAASPHFEQVFRAYVTDVAARRGCTGLEFPTGADFAARPEEAS